jgi:predicted nucleic acid-binding protein
MRKTKIFLDTTIISYYYEPDMPEREAETRDLWDYLIGGKYDISYQMTFLEK